MSRKEEFSEFEIPRLPNESGKAYAAKRDYLGLGSGRSIEKLVAQYLARIEHEAGTTVPSRHRSTIGLWSRKFNWVALAQEFDDFQGDRLIEQAMEERKAEYSEALKFFRDKNLAVGRGAFRCGADALKLLLEFLDTHPTIQTWSEANQCANLIRQLAPLANLWSQALALDRVLQNFDPADLG